VSLRTRFGYPIVAAAAVVGLLRQTQRWLPRYEWVSAHQLGYYVAGINFGTVIIGAAGVFMLGIYIDREVDHQWSVRDALSIAIVAAVGGLAIGTGIGITLGPGAASSSVGFFGPLAVYTVTEGVPIGLAAVAGLAVSRICAIERTEDAMAVRSVGDESTESATPSEAADSPAPKYDSETTD